MADPSTFNDAVGIRMTAWHEGEAVAELEIGPMHLNRSASLHGGVLCTLLDAVCARSGCWTPPGETQRRCSTVSLTVNFLRGAKGGLVRGTGRLRPGAGTQLFTALGEVHHAEGRLLALAQGTFKYRARPAPAA